MKKKRRDRRARVATRWSLAAGPFAARPCSATAFPGLVTHSVSSMN